MPQLVDLHPIPDCERETRYARPRTEDHWKRTHTPVALVLDTLAALGIDDPTEATAHLDRALELRAASRTATTPALSRAEIERKLGAGEMTEAEARKALQKAASPQLAAETGAMERESLNAAALEAYRLALAAIRDHGEDAWLAILREQTALALDERTEERWNLLHAQHDGLHTRLRECGAIATLPRAPWYFWHVGDPTARHAWQMERARLPQQRAQSYDRATRTSYRVAIPNPERTYRAGPVSIRIPEKGAQITFRVLLEHREAWKLDAYSADQVLDHVREIEAMHRRYLHPAAPEPRNRDFVSA